MGMYKYLRELWKKPKENLGDIWKERLIEWRKQPTTIRIQRPTRIDRARSLGYRAKQGFVIVRQKVLRGGHLKGNYVKKGRKPKRSSVRMNLDKNYQTIAEERASRKYNNCEVLNSYLAAEDGKHIWYEIILIDRAHPQIQAEEQLARIAAKKGRAERGLTASGRKSRGLTNKGVGAEKLRPSRSAVNKKRLSTQRK